MSKKSDRQFHFREMRGDYSTRIKANGNYEFFGNSPEKYKGFLEDTQTVYNEIKRLEALPHRTEIEHRILMNHIRVYGDRQKLIREASRYAFEKVFVQVANAMLPKDWFLAIVNESRNIWREDGFASDHLIDFHAARKQARRAKNKKYMQGINTKERFRRVAFQKWGNTDEKHST